MEKSSNPWTEYYAAKTESEKKEALKKIYPLLSPSELAVFRKMFPNFPETADQYTQSVFCGIEIDKQLLESVLGEDLNKQSQDSEGSEKTAEQRPMKS